GAYVTVQECGRHMVAAGSARRRRRNLRRGRALSPAELDRLRSKYEERHADDRERLEEIMQYAQSAGCRVRKLREYFSEPAGDPCGVCDNCRRPPVEQPAVPAPARRERRRAPRLSVRRPPFEPGDEVRHRTYGKGEVLEVSGENVVVAFVRRGKHRIRGAYLSRR